MESDGSPIPGLKVAGPADRKAMLPMQVAVDARWLAWFNERVLEAIRAGSNRQLTHLQFAPDPAKGLLYVLPAERAAYGAIRLDYGEAKTGARLSLYLPLRRFDLHRQPGRVRLFAVQPQVVDGRILQALDVAGSQSVPSRASGGDSGQDPG